ncbi:MAG: bifunctional transaldolase/phosoglucose isomerase, partial [Candidatus Eremiobacteraeota bacterium]|nr:bifunctional transaldolase/phosoglucose isomerase [Candidatus Eremiobacteraeota bacterium]
LRTLVDEREPLGVFEALAIRDIRSACDLFHPVWEATKGLDGYVSLEVSPALANDTQGTIDAARRLWGEVNRPNLMIKIPGTPEGMPAIRASIAAGININVTLLFSVDRYEAAANAYISGLEDRVAKNQPVDRIASVASFFVSRIDTAIDKQLQARIDRGENELTKLLGKAAVANTKIAYQRFLKLFGGDRFAALKAKGAHVQRPLWASTSTKNPAYPDLLYVEGLIARDTVNTVPPNTLDAILDHGAVRADTIAEHLDGARATIDALAKAQISLYDVTEELVADGVKSFADSFNAMLTAISEKLEKLRAGAPPAVGVAAPDDLNAMTDAAVDGLAQSGFLRKLWSHDASPWSNEPAHVEIIKRALGWVEIAQQTHAQSGELRDFANACAKRFDHVVVLGMGGSSLAPDILRATFGRTSGFPELHVLDSTDPQQIKALDDRLDVAKSLFIVASKSGTTTEPDAFYRYFHEKVTKVVGSTRAGAWFVAITDPGTKLETEAKDAGFRKVFTNDPNIGGRYSALSYFGLVPAAVAGYDLKLLVDRGLGAMHANDKTVAPADALGVRFGAAIGGFAKAGRDKLTIVTHPSIAAFGAWAEQLIAESTGKLGKGIVPIEGEPLAAPRAYGKDRVFVYLGAGLPNASAADEAALTALQEAGHPVVRLAMNDAYDVGEQFYLWEIATAAAGSLLGIDAFDQPNVQESKDNTKALLREYTTKGSFTEPSPEVTDAALEIAYLSGSKATRARDVRAALSSIFTQIKPGDYFAFTAYIARDDRHLKNLEDLRVKIRDAFAVATTVGFGPRFLHSTGQLHKGGPNTGVFMQITADAPFDFPIPGLNVGFRTLEAAQALGDFQSLDKRARRGVRVHLKGDIGAALHALTEAIDDAVTAKA